MREDWREPRLDPPEPKAVAVCAECGEIIYEGEIYYHLRDDDYCCECVGAGMRID